MNASVNGNSSSGGGSSSMNEPLNIAGETGSVSSQTSSGKRSSLLERIQMQRQREATANGAALPGQQPLQQIQVPYYGEQQQPPPPQGFGGGGGAPMPGEQQQQQQQQHVDNQNVFTSAWNTLSNGYETGAAAAEPGSAMEDALLPPSAGGAGDGEYPSMSNYALTFVYDVYGLFLRLHVVLRVVVVVALLYLVIKLL